MHKLAIEALRHKYQADMADAEFVFQVYFDRPAGVGEHPGLLEEMDAALTKEMADAEEEEPTLFDRLD